MPFLEDAADWDGELVRTQPFVTGIGAGTTYPDYKPAPFIVASEVQGVDMVTVVSEGIFSYCGLKVKIDTDRYLGPEQAAVRADGEQIGHVTTAEYGSQMLSLGGVRHLTGGSKREGNVTCQALLELCNRAPVEVTVDGGAAVTLQAGAAPIVNGVQEERMRVGCGSAAIGIFAKQWSGHADEVIVVDDHITGVLTEHQAGRFLDMPPAGIRVRGRRSTPGRYFQVAEPGSGWGGTDIVDPLAIIEKIDPKVAWPGLRLLMVSTTGEDAAWYVLDEQLRPLPAPMPAPITAAVERIAENCEPALTTVLFMAGAGGSLRAGVTENPVRLTRSVRDALTRVTCGGAPVYVWPGGGITLMVDVTPHARARLRLRADAGPGGADRVHPAARRLRGARRLSRPHRAARRGAGRAPARAARPGRGQPLAGRCRPSPWSRTHDGRGAGRRCSPTAGACTCTTGRSTSSPQAFGDPAACRRAYRQAAARFATILAELVEELPLLRQPIGDAGLPVEGAVARRMAAAVWPHRETFVTPMAAVAGAVADEVLAAMLAGRPLAQGLCQRRRRHRAGTWRRASPCAPASSPTRTCPRSTPWSSCTHAHAGARHGDLGLARPLLLARHRRCGDRAGARARPRRMPRRRCRQRGRLRPSGDRANARAASCATTPISAIFRSRSRSARCRAHLVARRSERGVAVRRSHARCRADLCREPRPARPEPRGPARQRRGAADLATSSHP